MGQQWYYKDFGEVIGPITSMELAQLAKTGKIAYFTRVRLGPTGEWVAARKVKGLFSQASIPPVNDIPRQNNSPPSLISALRALGWGKGGFSILVVVLIAVAILMFVGAWNSSPRTPSAPKDTASSLETPSGSERRVRELVESWLKDQEKGGDGHGFWHRASGAYVPYYRSFYALRSWEVLDVKFGTPSPVYGDDTIRQATVYLRVNSSDSSGIQITVNWRVHLLEKNWGDNQSRWAIIDVSK